MEVNFLIGFLPRAQRRSVCQFLSCYDDGRVAGSLHCSQVDPDWAQQEAIVSNIQVSH